MGFRIRNVEFRNTVALGSNAVASKLVSVVLVAKA